ncbi:MAG: glycosyltransferase [Lachnospiraceae bacterium]|nr:glycosyltransferase [Lachnospiraceae bacterium]
MGRLDVVIPVYRPDRRFYKLIRMIFSQSEQPGKVQVMLTLSGAEGEEDKLISRINAIRVKMHAEQTEIAVTSLTKAEFDHGGTRNRGIAACHAPYVLCITADAVPADANLFRTMIDAMERDNDTIAVYARQVAPQSAGKIVRYTQNFNYPSSSLRKTSQKFGTLGIKAIFCSDVCCLYHRNRFFCLDGFEEPVLFGEDMLFAGKALEHGYAVFYEAAAVVEHGHAFSLVGTFRRNFDSGVNQADHAELFRKLSSEKEGMKYVKYMLGELRKEHAYFAMAEFVFQCAAKYAGFLLGKHYRVLPKALVKKLTNNAKYFENT